MAAEAEIGGAGASTSRRTRLIVIGAAALGVLLLAGGGLYVFMASTAPGANAASGAQQAIARTPTFIFNLEPMTVNLSSEDGSASYLRMTIALEVVNEEMMHQIQPSLAKIIDAFQVYLRELRRSDLEGSAGIYRLKEELTRRINVAIYPARVENILFKELLVQ